MGNHSQRTKCGKKKNKTNTATALTVKKEETKKKREAKRLISKKRAENQQKSFKAIRPCFYFCFDFSRRCFRRERKFNEVKSK